MWQWSTHEVRGQLTGTGSLLHLVGSRNQTHTVKFGSKHFDPNELTSQRTFMSFCFVLWPTDSV